MKKLLLYLSIFVLFIAGCSSNSGGSANEYVAAEEAKEGYLAESDVYYETEVTEETSEGGIDPAASSEKLIYKGSLYVETLEYKEAKQEIKDLINKFEGIVEYESEYTSGARWYTNEEGNIIMHSEMRLRIPTKFFEAFLASMEGAGQVVSKDTQVINITKQYNDNNARIEALETQQKRLLEMMDKAETIEDMIAIEARLTEVQSDLNILKSNKSSMDTDIEYSTITLHLDEVKKYTDVNRSFGIRFTQAFEDSWYSFLNTLEDIVIFLIHALPYILIALIVIFILKKANIKLPKRKKKENKEEEIEVKENEKI